MVIGRVLVKMKNKVKTSPLSPNLRVVTLFLGYRLLLHQNEKELKKKLKSS